MDWERFMKISWKGATVLSLGFAFLASSIAAKSSGIVINSTPSEPLGIWKKVSPPRLVRGSTVLACPPNTPTMITALDRGYLLPGSCPGGLGTVMKQIVGIENDTVDVRADGLIINGIWFSHTPLATIDSKGRPLDAKKGRYIIQKDQVFLASDYTPKSFDSRYFGPVSTSAVRSTMLPLLTTNWKPSGF